MNEVSFGKHRGHSWIWSPDAGLDGLLVAFPEIVLGYVVGVTSFDSDRLVLTSDELASGWRESGDVALSPRVSDVDGLPRAGWDEWYVWREPIELPALEVFVNYGNFTPNPSLRLDDHDPSWDRGVAADAVRMSNERAGRFWKQLSVVRPLAFLAEGDALSCVVKDDVLFSRILAAARGGAL